MSLISPLPYCVVYGPTFTSQKVVSPFAHQIIFILLFFSYFMSSATLSSLEFISKIYLKIHFYCHSVQDATICLPNVCSSSLTGARSCHFWSICPSYRLNSIMPLSGENFPADLYCI